MIRNINLANLTCSLENFLATSAIKKRLETVKSKVYIADCLSPVCKLASRIYWYMHVYLRRIENKLEDIV